MNSRLIKGNYNINVSDIDLLDSHFGTELYSVIADDRKYIVKVMPLSFDNVDEEGRITDFLRGRGLRVAKLLKSKTGYYAVKTPEFQFTVQEYIEGETLSLNNAPEWFMEKSAEFLGKTALNLKNYPQLPIRFDRDFFSADAAVEKMQQYISSLGQIKKSGELNSVSVWEDQIRHLERVSKFQIDTDKLTYTGSHGDYHIGQAIVKDGDITVIDWTSACRLPICLEIITSYAFASPACAGGAVDAEGLNRYICGFRKYFPLTEYDVRAMPYVFYFWHCMCNYRPDEYADIAESYRPVARLINNLLNWLYGHVEELSEALTV